MKIITWNVNGIRAVWKKGELQNLIQKEMPDILCLQETKSEEIQLTEEMKSFLSYHSFFESSQMRKGYSGVAIYTREKPLKVSGILANVLQDKDFRDDEGRFIMAEYEKFFIMNCYWPNGGKSPEHFLYKLEYYKKFLKLACKLEKIKPIVFCGDINATVSDLDLARPKENAGELGCTPEERHELSLYCEKFTDTWRKINPDKQEYTWWDMKTRARDRNVGWRIDYVFVSKILEQKIKRVEILNLQLGSDHCPVVLELDL